MKYPIRINKYLRDKGLASRREADKLIFVGEVLVNGKRAEMGMLVQEGDKVILRQKQEKEYIYLAYYKPRGLATQATGNSESVIAEWRERGVFPVGRLDKESEGLLILTNDGRLTTRLTGPDSRFDPVRDKPPPGGCRHSAFGGGRISNGVEKEYIVNVQEGLSKGISAIFEKGMQTKTFGRLLPAKARIIDRHTLRVVLFEGKRHQIRVMLSELRYTIIGIKRVRIGHILIGNLRPGQTRKLTEKEARG